MKYNYREIGDRIRTERKKKYRNQDDFLEALKEKNVSIGRNTLSRIECGEVHDIKFSVLLAMCELFECDICFLLGDSPYNTKEKRTAGKLLGLSPQELDGLISLGIQSKSGVKLLLEKHSKSLKSMLDILSWLPASYGNSLMVYTDPRTGKEELVNKINFEYSAGIFNIENCIKEIVEKEIDYKAYLGLDIPPELLPKKQ